MTAPAATATSAANLNARLVRALDQVEVSADPWRARVGDRDLSADTGRQLVGELAVAIYDVLHAGRHNPTGPQPKSLRDPEFEQALRDEVPHRFCWMDSIAIDASDAGVVVPLDGLRVLVPLAALAGEPPAETGEPVRFRVPATRPAASPGFLLVRGEHGAIGHARDLLRIYLHLSTADAAPAVWGSMLRALNELDGPYQAKVISARRLYPRRDALVVYLDPTALPLVPSLVAALPLLQVDADVSVFAEPLAPGMAWAWEPSDHRPGNRARSLGEHRSRAVAEALVAHAAGDADPDRCQAVVDAFRAANIDPERPHRNLDSPTTTPEEC